LLVVQNDLLINVRDLVSLFDNETDLVGKRINGGFDPKDIEWSESEDNDDAGEAGDEVDETYADEES